MMEGNEPSVLDRQDVESGSFGHIVVAIEQNSGFLAPVLGLEHAGGEITPIIVLYPWVDAFLGDAPHRFRDPGASLRIWQVGTHRPDIGNAPGIEIIATVARITRSGDQRHTT